MLKQNLRWHPSGDKPKKLRINLDRTQDDVLMMRN